MFNILPRQIDNRFECPTVALWLFGLILAPKLAMAGEALVNTQAVVMGPDAIAFETFSPQRQQAFLSIFKALGWSLLFLPLLGIAALIQYRSMIPLLFLMLLIENIGRIAIGRLFPILSHEGSWVSSMIYSIMLGVMALGLFSSLQKKRPKNM